MQHRVAQRYYRPSSSSSELTVSHSVTDTDGIFDVTYQWLRDGVPIPSATSITYTLSPSDTGKHLSVEVSHRDGRGKPDA